MKALIIFFLLASAYNANGDTIATYRASNGPVTAVLELNEGLLGKISISYDGYLYRCGCGHYSCTGNAVKALMITPTGNPNKNNVYEFDMKPECTNFYGPGPEKDAATLALGDKYSRTALWWSETLKKVWREGVGDLNHYYYGEELPLRVGRFEMAFTANGRWDSNHGKNYKLLFQKVEE